MFLTIGAVNKDTKSKKKKDFADNDSHNFLRFFDVLPKFPFTISQT